jgi:hypothetical protein
MRIEVTNKRLVIQVADKIVITDIDICQRIYPATVKFTEIEAAVEVDTDASMVMLDFGGCERDGYYDGEADIPAAKRQLALEVADMLKRDGVVVTERPIE